MVLSMLPFLAVGLVLGVASNGLDLRSLITAAVMLVVLSAIFGLFVSWVWRRRGSSLLISADSVKLLWGTRIVIDLLWSDVVNVRATSVRRLPLLWRLREH